MVLDDNRLVLGRRHGGHDVDAVGARHEKRSLAAGELVPNMKHRYALLAGIGKYPDGIGYRRLNTAQGQLAGGQIFVLKVDHDQSALFHGAVSSLVGGVIVLAR